MWGRGRRAVCIGCGNRSPANLAFQTVAVGMLGGTAVCSGRRDRLLGGRRAVLRGRRDYISLRGRIVVRLVMVSIWGKSMLVVWFKGEVPALGRHDFFGVVQMGRWAADWAVSRE